MADSTIAGFSKARLDRIDGWAQRYVDEGRISGGQVAIVRGGEPVLHRTYGLRDLERGTPTTEDTVYRIYSMTKPITSVALMMLWEDGLFQLDHPVGRLIPGWEDLQVRVGGSHPDFETRPPARPMQIRDLLTHQAGLSYGFVPTAPIDAAYHALGVSGLDAHNGTLADMMAAVAKAPLEYDPGTQWKYSIATDVCGYLVEHFSGQPLDRFFRERIFEPLGMTDTGFHVTEEQRPQFASHYRRRSTRELAVSDDGQESPYLKPATRFSGGGGLVSTTGDYVRFCQMLLEGGTLDGERILAPSTIDLMTQNHLPNNAAMDELSGEGYAQVSRAGVGFGLGVAVHIDQQRSLQSQSLGAYYWGGAASTHFWVDPAEDLAVVWMTQIPSGTYDFPRQLSSLVYSSLVQ
ncbi:MAG: beta-lactamase family protein [Dehalococcoidia bacterium]|nr:beta-lactamase family protein [Dehalococcoidia bacterium]